MLIETDYLTYPPIRNNLSSTSLPLSCAGAILKILQYLIKCFRSMTMANLLSMLIETDYNFKKITAVSFGSCLKEFHSVWYCLFIKQTQNFFTIITFCLKYVGAICFVVSGSARVAHFTRLCLKAVTEPNSAEPTELTEYSLF